MMRKYNKPEIETLALETVDVIETSGIEGTTAALKAQQGVVATPQTLEGNIATMSTDWQW